MLFSLIIPLWNCETQIRTCLQSIVQQNIADEDLEIIVCNDGSTDNSASAVQQFIVAHPKHSVRLLNQPNGGPGSARNKALELAQGDYILFVDADDSLQPNALENYRRAIGKFPEAQVIFSNFNCQNAAGSKSIYDLGLPVNQLNINRAELWLLPPAPWNKLIKHSFLKANPDMRFYIDTWYEDLGFYLILLLHKPLWSAIPQATYNYCYNPDSTMNAKQIDKNRCIIEVLAETRTRYQNLHALDACHKELEAVEAYHGYLSVITRLLKAGANKAELRHYYKWMKRNCPDYQKNPYLSKKQKFLGRLYDFYLKTRR